MRTYKNRLAIFILLILFLLSGLAITSCSKNTSNNPKKETSQIDNSKDYKQFDLTVDNFEHFFYFKSSLNGLQAYNTHSYIYEVIGVLNYAYYDNVIVTFDVVYIQNNKSYKGKYSLTLNASGYTSFTSKDSELLNAVGCAYYDFDTTEVEITVETVTGKIILFNQT